MYGCITRVEKHLQILDAQYHTMDSFKPIEPDQGQQFQAVYFLFTYIVVSYPSMHRSSGTLMVGKS